MTTYVGIFQAIIVNSLMDLSISCHWYIYKANRAFIKLKFTLRTKLDIQIGATRINKLKLTLREELDINIGATKQPSEGRLLWPMAPFHNISNITQNV